MSQNDQLADIAVTSVSMGRPMLEGLNKLSLDAAFDVADRLTAKIEVPNGGLGGYKIAWNTDAQMEAFGLPHPGMGRVFKKFLRQSGAKLALADFKHLMIETEIVAFLGADLLPEQTHTAQSVRDAVDSFTVGFEILNRLEGAEDATAHAIIAHNVFNAGAVLGDVRLPAADLTPETITTRFTQDDRVVFEDVGKAPQDPFEAIAFLANHFTGRGFKMSAGQMILCGSHIPLYEVTAPGEFSVSMSALGDVTFSAL